MELSAQVGVSQQHLDDAGSRRLDLMGPFKLYHSLLGREGPLGTGSLITGLPCPGWASAALCEQPGFFCLWNVVGSTLRDILWGWEPLIVSAASETDFPLCAVALLSGGLAPMEIWASLNP